MLGFPFLFATCFGPAGSGRTFGSNSNPRSNPTMCNDENRPDPEVGSVWLMPRSTNVFYKTRYRMVGKSTTYSNCCPSFLLQSMDNPNEPMVNITAQAFWNNAEPEPVAITVSFDWLYSKGACLPGIHKAIDILKTSGLDYDTEFNTAELLRGNKIAHSDALWILEKKGVINNGHTHAYTRKELLNLLEGKPA